MEVFQTLGINPVLVIAQIVSFSILLFVLNKFLYKKIQTALEERRDSVRITLEKQGEMERRLLSMEEEQKVMKKKAQIEAREAMNEAKKSAEDAKKQILAEAEVKGKRLVDSARERIDQEVAQAQDHLKNQAGILAREIAQKVLTEKSSGSDFQKGELEKSLDELKTIKKKRA